MYLSLKGSLGHTAITDRVGESLLQIAEGSSAAYSLRNLGSDSPSVVRVRRESDNAERDFTAQDINTSVVENWVNQQIIPPLDLRELTPTGRDGPLIEATAAYSLRSLGTNQWSYGGDTVTYTSDFSAGTDGWYADSASSATATPDPVGTLDVLQYTIDTETTAKYLSLTSLNAGQQYLVQAEVYVPSSNVDLDSIVLMDGAGFMATSYLGIQRDEWVAVSTVGTANIATINIRGASGTTASAYNGFQGNGTDVFYARNVVISETLGDSNYLPAGKYVTQVRRTSDDQVRSFTAAEVSNGTLLAWVNADVVTYTSDFSGGIDGWQAQNGTAAGNIDSIGGRDDCLRFTYNTSNTYHQIQRNNSFVVGSTYEVSVDVYVPSGQTISSKVTINDYTTEVASSTLTDQWETISAIITPTIDGFMRIASNAGLDAAGDDVFYVRNVVVTQTSADGHVSTWYDQSGNTKHATQATAASQPKIVDAGALVAGGIDFDGAGQKLNTPTTSVLNIDGAKDKSIFAKGTFTIGESFIFLGGLGGNGEALRYRSSTDGNARFEVQSTGVSGDSLLGANGAVYSSIFSGTQFSDSDVSANGLITEAIGTLAINSADTVLGIGYVNGSTSEGSGQLSELIIYNSDQSDNRTALEANIGETYSITGIPAYDNTVNGFVEAWYDQSGNGYDAVQLTASNQPKIVDAGALVLSNGNAAIKSISDNRMNFTFDSLSADGQQSVFSVLENDVTSQDNFSSAVSALSSSTATGGVNRRPYWFIGPDGNLVFSVDSLSGYITSDKDRRLYSHIMEDTAGGTSTVYQDGTQVYTNSITLDANPNFIFGQIGAVGANAVGALYISEVIYYPSDESAKRAAIEDNIDNHYGITSTGSYVNAAGDSYINAAGDTYLQP